MSLGFVYQNLSTCRLRPIANEVNRQDAFVAREVADFQALRLADMFDKGLRRIVRSLEPVLSVVSNVRVERNEVSLQNLLVN